MVGIGAEDVNGVTESEFDSESITVEHEDLDWGKGEVGGKQEDDTAMGMAYDAYRYHHDHPRAMDIFLASALPLAEPTARRRASKIFVHPSDLQIELMYGGAVEAVITVFQTKCVLKPEEDSFRRYLLRSMVLGAVRAYFRREENHGIRTAADLTALAASKWHCRNEAEDEIITWELLVRVISSRACDPR